MVDVKLKGPRALQYVQVSLMMPFLGPSLAVKLWRGTEKLGRKETWENDELRAKHGLRRSEIAYGFQVFGIGLAVLAIEIMLFVGTPIAFFSPEESEAFDYVLAAFWAVGITAALLLLVGRTIEGDSTPHDKVLAMERDLVKPTLF